MTNNGDLDQFFYNCPVYEIIHGYLIDIIGRYLTIIDSNPNSLTTWPSVINIS